MFTKMSLVKDESERCTGRFQVCWLHVEYVHSIATAHDCSVAWIPACNTVVQTSRTARTNALRTSFIRLACELNPLLSRKPAIQVWWWYGVNLFNSIPCAELIWIEKFRKSLYWRIWPHVHVVSFERHCAKFKEHFYWIEKVLLHWLWSVTLELLIHWSRSWKVGYR